MILTLCLSCKKSLAPSREGTAQSPPTPGSCSTSSTITAARGTLSTIGSFNPFLPEHFLSTGFLGSLKLFHFHVFDLAFLCRSIKSQKKSSKPPKPPSRELSHQTKRSVPPMSLQQLFFLKCLRRLTFLGAVTKYLQSFYHLFKLILLSHKWHKIVHIISLLFHGTVLLTQTIAWNGMVRRPLPDIDIDSSVRMLRFAVPRRIAHWLSVQIITCSGRQMPEINYLIWILDSACVQWCVGICLYQTGVDAC